MQPNHLLGSAAVAGHLANRQRGGVARDDAVVADRPTKLAVQRLLEREVLDHRLDDHVAAGERLDAQPRRDAA